MMHQNFQTPTNFGSPFLVAASATTAPTTMDKFPAAAAAVMDLEKSPQDERVVDSTSFKANHPGSGYFSEKNVEDCGQSYHRGGRGGDGFDTSSKSFQRNALPLWSLQIWPNINECIRQNATSTHLIDGVCRVLDMTLYELRCVSDILSKASHPEKLYVESVQEHQQEDGNNNTGSNMKTSEEMSGVSVPSQPTEKLDGKPRARMKFTPVRSNPVTEEG